MKKFLVTLLAIGMAFSCCACGGGKNNDDGDQKPVGIPLTAEDEQKVDEVVERVDYVLEVMPDLDDLMGGTVKAVAVLEQNHVTVWGTAEVSALENAIVEAGYEIVR